MKSFIYIILTSIMLLGCKYDTYKAEGDIAYLGGEIINPNNNFIVLSKSEAIIDTIKLDGRNRFMYKVENLQEGIYTFKHGGEFQIVLLEPNDSILFRLNTLDFDESLVFTGTGAKENNYLVNDFLENEKTGKSYYQFCKLKSDFKSYEKRVDSIKSQKVKTLKAFINKYNTSNLFNEIAKSNIDYNYYFSKEIYPFVHYGQSKQDILKSLPDNFYEYRKEVDYNNDFLKENFIYNSFLKYSFNNLALQEHLAHSNNAHFKKISLCYNLDKLHLIDSLIENVDIKNHLLHGSTLDYLSFSESSENNIAILNSYLSKSKDEKGIKMMTRFVNSLNNLKEGANLPSVKIINYNDSEIDLASVIESPTVVSFWSHTFYNHFKESQYKIKDLKAKYPEVKFIAINIDDYGLEKSKRSLKNNRFSCNDQYHFKNPEESIEVLAIHPMTKTIIVDKDKRIVNSNTNLFSVKFEEQLLGLLNSH